MESFFYTNSDGFGGSDFASVTITVTVDPLNGNLVANPDSFTVAKGTTVNLDVLANDNILPASGAALTIISVGAPDHGGLVGLNGIGANNSLTYTPNSANAFPLIETLTYVVSGGGIARATGTVSILVIDRANTLTANDDTFAVIANGANYPLDVLERVYRTNRRMPTELLAIAAEAETGDAGIAEGQRGGAAPSLAHTPCSNPVAVE